MIMMTMHFLKDEQGKPQVPFKTVYVTKLIRDDQGEKMSKSKGNVIDPLDMIDGISLDKLVESRTSNMMQDKLAQRIANRTKKEFPEGIAAHGTDALRFTLAALASTGRDINWDMKRLDGYRNFCNKLWNASRFVLMNTEQQTATNNTEDMELSLADQWIIERFNDTVKQFRHALDNYRFDQAANIAYEFTWHQFCDWYLELTKPVFNGGSDAQLRGTRHTLLTVLEQLLRLLHPIMPYITEEIWQRVAPLAGVETNSDSTIMLQAYPQVQPTHYQQASADMEWIKKVIVAVRTIRAEMNLSPSQSLDVFISGADDTVRRRVEDNKSFLKALARLESIAFINTADEAPASATALVGRVEFHIPMAGLIDKEAELARLDKSIEKVLSDLGKVKGKLANENFVSRAPANVIEQEKERLVEGEATLAQLQQQREKIATL